MPRYTDERTSCPALSRAPSNLWRSPACRGRAEYSDPKQNTTGQGCRSMRTGSCEAGCATAPNSASTMLLNPNCAQSLRPSSKIATLPYVPTIVGLTLYNMYQSSRARWRTKNHHRTWYIHDRSTNTAASQPPTTRTAIFYETVVRHYRH